MKKKRKILLITPLFNGLSTGIAHALEDLGFDVQHIIFDKLFSRIFIAVASRISLDNYLKYTNAHLISLIKKLSVSFKPDFTIIVRGDLIPLEIFEILQSTTIIQWENDNLEILNTFNLKKASSYVDLFCSYFKPDKKEAIDLGYKNFLYLPTGYPSKIFHPINLTKTQQKKYKSDFVFIGVSYNYRTKCFNNLHNLDYQIYGSGYPPHIKTKKKRVSIDTGNILYNATNIGVSIHKKIMGINDRVFSICGSGCFCLVDDINNLNEFYDIGKEIITFSSPEDFHDKVLKYNQDCHLRKKIAQKGYQRTINNHTYTHRMKMLFDYINK
ncbi:hypothetical protein DID76_02340 [Candidatus Marinamargulisbacteria bacterium SCGC AG-414-C22]|nr:hypothetical protein DID76_02340 [Candidatus Marinamargulisbacteria bacterium SCGC AG-414-C22]